MTYVGFGYAGGNWLSRLIAWFQGGKTKISHAFFLYRDPTFGWVVLGAEARGFYPAPASSWSPSYVVDLFAVPGLEAALAANRDALGAPYDFAGLVGMTWVEFVRWAFRRRVSNPLTKAGAWFCSAIVAAVVESGGIDCPGEPRATDPATIRRTLAARGFVRARFEEVIAS